MVVQCRTHTAVVLATVCSTVSSTRTLGTRPISTTVVYDTTYYKRDSKLLRRACHTTYYNGTQNSYAGPAFKNEMPI